MAAKPKKPSKAEAFRLAVLAQAEELCIPGFMTPLWQAKYGKKA